MDILLVMCVGVLIGNRWFPQKYKRANELLQVACTVLLIFCMGVTLGGRNNFLEELASMGAVSFLFFLFPVGFSLMLVYLLTKRFMPEKAKREKAKGTENVQLSGSETAE